MAVMQPLRVDHERLVRGEYAKVGVEAWRDPPLRGKPGELGRSPRHPARDLAQRHASALCLGPYDRQAELEGGDARSEERRVGKECGSGWVGDRERGNG